MDTIIDIILTTDNIYLSFAEHSKQVELLCSAKDDKSNRL